MPAARWPPTTALSTRADPALCPLLVHCFCGIWVLWPELWCAEHVQPEPIRLGQQRHWETWAGACMRADAKRACFTYEYGHTREVVGNRNLVGQPRTIRVNWNVIVLKQGRAGLFRLLLFSFIAGLRTQLHLFRTFNCNCRSLSKAIKNNLIFLYFAWLYIVESVFAELFTYNVE